MNAKTMELEHGSSQDYRDAMRAASMDAFLFGESANEPHAVPSAEDAMRELRRRLFTLKVKRVHADAQMPRYATEGAACFDVCAVGLGTHTHALQAGDAYIFRTGLAFEVPAGHVMLVFSRSGHGFKNSVRLANCVGVIDSDYRGELMVRLTADVQGKGIGVRNGDRIAQCMLMRVQQWDLVEVDTLTPTGRGTGGLGSTGR